jgi:hypothetical protein
MLCPVCGRSDGLCDCLLASAPRDANDGAGSGPVAVQGIPVAFDGPPAVIEAEGPDRQTGSQPMETGSRADWSDSLLQFVRDFTDASSKAASAETAAQFERDRSVGPRPEGTSPGLAGQQTTADGRTAAASTEASVPKSPSSPFAMPAPDSPAGGPLRIAPFVTSKTAADGEAKADAPGGLARSASTSGSSNSSWSGNELEWGRAGNG